MKTLWIVSEGSPGHISQSVGLAEGIAALEPVQTVIINGRAKIRGWLRPLVRHSMGKTGNPLSDHMLQWVAEVEIPENCPAPDLVISSGGKSVYAATTLARRNGVPYIYIGERKPYPAEWFHTVVSPVLRESSTNSIDVELIPTSVPPELIAQKGKVAPGLWCMIIGGASRSHRFEELDWINLAKGMNAQSERKNIRWLLTTSRRTGTAAEAALKKYLNPDILEDAIWWAEKPRKELYEFMVLSEVLFVTQDSVTMVTEAVSVGKPVVAIYPSRVDFPDDSFMRAYLDRLETNGRIARLETRILSDFNFGKMEFSPLKENMLASASKELCRRLGWSKEA